MKQYILRLLLTVACMPVSGLIAQDIHLHTTMRHALKGKLVKYFPYANVQVIDNRLDTTKVFIQETGIYPPHPVSLAQPASLFIKNYIDNSVRISKKGPLELLINIEQLYIPNIHNSLRKYKTRQRPWQKQVESKEVIGTFPIRAYLHFQATAWYKNEQGNYNKLLTINREVQHYNYEIHKYVMSRLLNDCIQAIAFNAPDPAMDTAQLPARLKRLINDTVSYQSANGEKNIPFEQINVNVRKRWRDYPVVKEGPAVAGVYYVFEDFKQNHITPATVQLTFNEKDSVYHLAAGTDSILHNKPHWGVYDGTNWYINLSDSIYFKLARQDDAFGFYIPRNMPDMYALLSMQENYLHSSSSAVSGGGNILFSVLATLVSGAIQGGIENGENRRMVKRITAEGLKHSYRYCTINMDNGDILFGTK